MKKINQKIISRRTHIILFVLSPLILYCLGFYMIATANVGLWGIIFYMPMAVNLLCSWFFKTEGKTKSIFSKIPEKYLNLLLVLFLIFCMAILPIMAYVSIFDISAFPVFKLNTDGADIFFGILCAACSVIVWIIFLLAVDAFRTIKFFIQNYSLPGIAVVSAIVLTHRYFVTGDLFFALMGFMSLILFAGCLFRRHSMCHY